MYKLRICITNLRNHTNLISRNSCFNNLKINQKKELLLNKTKILHKFMF